jgi:hypothetical protein
MELRTEFLKWLDETQSLLVLGLGSNNPNKLSNPLEGNQSIIDEVVFRCEERYGPEKGRIFFGNLLVSLPLLRSELFPELREKRD